LPGGRPEIARHLSRVTAFAHRATLRAFAPVSDRG
jgi:hypothetical protein